MLTWKQALARYGTKPYRPSRVPVRFLDGPFAGGIAYIDDLSQRLTAPIKIGDQTGFYIYEGTGYRKGAIGKWVAI